MKTLKSSVKIYCRIRPLEDLSDFNCVEVANDERTITLVPLKDSPNSEKSKEVLYSFNRVFSDVSIQKEIFDHVAYPLVRDLLKGKNGLIFTHGIASSGKTYTMNGMPEDEGLIPRSLDVIFNTIQDHQASKYVFKSNKLNGFEIQPITEALIDQQKHLAIFSKTPTPKRNENIGEWSNRVADSYIVDGVLSDKKYSIFISYVEIYNNYIYDLLEDIAVDQNWKNRSSKMLREDSSHNMYVFNAVESEVKTVKEALELFCKGQLRRKFSNTHLSNESSRSHCVFTIRVVQAPIDPHDPEILQKQDKMIISQLSFVDLASCERSLGTKVVYRKLHEAENMNTTLKVLISCIDILMKSQTGVTSKMVPYQESKLTHLFKMFFEGKGEIRMIVCVNPHIEHYDETAKFMKFVKTTTIPKILFNPKVFSRKTGHSDLYQEAIKNAKQQGVYITEVFAPDTDSDFLQMETSTLDEESTYTHLIENLKKRRTRRKACKQDFKIRQEEFRNKLISVDKENIQLKQDNKLLEIDLNARVDQLHSLELKLSSAEEVIEALEKELEKSKNQLKAAQIELQSKNERILDLGNEVENVKTRMKEKFISEKYNLKRRMERRLDLKKAEIERKMCSNAEKFRQLRDILNTDDWDCLDNASPGLEPSSENLSSFTDVSESRGENKKWMASEKSLSETKTKSSKTSSCLGLLPACKLRNSSRLNQQSSKSNIESQHYDKNSEIHGSIKTSSSYLGTDNNLSSRTSIKKLSFATDIQPDSQSISHTNQPTNNASLCNAAFQYLLRGSSSNFSKEKRDSNSFLSFIRRRKVKSNDDIWLEHRPIGNLELTFADDYVPPILKKKTVSSLSMKDVTKCEASHYVLQHQQLDCNGSLAVELYKADIIPSSGGGAQVVFKDVVKMLKTFPQSHRLKRLDNESVPLRETEKRCAIAIECHGISTQNLKKR